MLYTDITHKVGDKRNTNRKFITEAAVTNFYWKTYFVREVSVMETVNVKLLVVMKPPKQLIEWLDSVNDSSTSNTPMLIATLYIFSHRSERKLKNLNQKYNNITKRVLNWNLIPHSPGLVYYQHQQSYYSQISVTLIIVKWFTPPKVKTQLLPFNLHTW